MQEFPVPIKNVCIPGKELGLNRDVNVVSMGYSNMIAVFITGVEKLGTMVLVTPELLPSTTLPYSEDRENSLESIPSVDIKPVLGSHGPSDIQTVYTSTYAQLLYAKIMKQNPAESRPILLNCSMPRNDGMPGEAQLQLIRNVIDRVCTDCRVW